MVAEVLKKLLIEKYKGVDLNQPLLAQLDSLLLVDLLIDLEAEFKVEIESIEANHENFRNFQTLQVLIEKKIASQK